MNYLSHSDRFRAILSDIHAMALERKGGRSPALNQGARFITISRQAGAGGKTLGEGLIKAIHQIKPAEEPWHVWDRELVHRVSAEHRIPEEYIEKMEDGDHRWFSEWVTTFLSAEYPGDYSVYRHAAMTVRAIAEAGRAVIVGRGGVFVTAGLSGGIHLRLVAPLDYRIHRMADRLKVSLDEAAVTVHEIDRNRAAFYHRYWPEKRLEPETFTLTLNTARMTDAQMVACVLPLITDAKDCKAPASTVQKAREESRYASAAVNHG